MAARIIDVERKPHKCSKCGERVVDIIYGTGNMTESEFLMEFCHDLIPEFKHETQSVRRI